MWYNTTDVQVEGGFIMSKGILAVVSGFSGVGKGTLVRRLLSDYDDYVLSISATTREPREGEKDGVDYFFLTRQEFENGIEDGQFLEYNCYLDNYYGTPKKWIEDRIAEGKNVILEIEMNGGLNVKQAYPQAKLIFILPPNIDELARRLRGRKTETEEQIKARLAKVEEEKEFIEKYDCVLVNDVLDDAVRNLNGIIKNIGYPITLR